MTNVARKSHDGRTVVRPSQALGSISRRAREYAARVPVYWEPGSADMDHDCCKQPSRPMPAPAMAAIRVRRSRRWVTCEEA
jgi:hypothetical protein